MSWFGNKLDMIDIYEYNILIYDQKLSKLPMTKPRLIRGGNWSERDMMKMKQNRKEAQDLYDRIKDS